VIESTFNWYWLVDGLQAAGLDVKLVNTAALVQYDGLKYSGDQHDARHLAHLLRLNLLHFGYAFPPQWRAVRDLARKRAQLFRTRSTRILALETIYARQTGGHLSGRAAKALDIEDVARLGWAEDVTLAAQVNVLAVQAMERGIAIVEKRLHERVKLTPDYAVLKTVPGIGEILSTVIMLETGSIERFTSAGNYASSARCVGSGRYSNNKKKGEGNRKNGNTYLAWAFVEAAHFALKHNDAAKRFYDRKRAHGNTSLATKALAHKLARACNHMLKGQIAFDEKRCFA
jgi:transposase